MRPLRIAILTFHFSENFGALFQAFSLKTWLERQGHTVEFINYHPPHVEDGGDVVGLLDPRRFKANAKILYLKFSSLQRRLFGNRKQAEAFAEFRSEVLGLHGARLRTRAEVNRFLAGLVLPFDLLVVGSDQIWAPSQQHGLDPVYFADLAVGPATRRISYAASLGRASVAMVHSGELRTLLARIDGLSVRERTSVEIVHALCGRDVACVPDPTILLGDFADLVTGSNQSPSGHVFCYALRSGKGIREVAAWIAGRMSTDVLSPYNAHRRWREIGRTVYPSPQGWVTLLDRAGFVVTNSFHGAVFSILRKRPFLVVGLPGARAELNERALNLLADVGLTERFVSNGDLEVARARFAEPINWSGVEPRLQALQQSGRDYLKAEIAKAMRA